MLHINGPLWSGPITNIFQIFVAMASCSENVCPTINATTRTQVQLRLWQPVDVVWPRRIKDGDCLYRRLTYLTIPINGRPEPPGLVQWHTDARVCWTTSYLCELKSLEYKYFSLSTWRMSMHDWFILVMWYLRSCMKRLEQREKEDLLTLQTISTT